MAVSLGFGVTASEEIVAVIAEFSSELLTYEGRGTITLRGVQDGARCGIEVRACDRGPRVANEESFQDDDLGGGGTLGYRLDRVCRLMDEVELSSLADSGTQVVARRWLRAPEEGLRARVWEVGVVTRPRYFVAENGDAFVSKESPGGLLVGLIDGLGHGEAAQRAALAAQEYVQAHHEQPLEKIFAGVGLACRGTRGVVMALARFSSETHLSFASVGNVEVRALSGQQRIPFAVTRGFLGTQEPQCVVQEFAWDPYWLLVLHTDGLGAHWQWADFRALEHDSAQTIAAKLMRKLADEHDDATVLAVRSELR